MQLFVSDKGFVKVYGMKSEKEFINTLKLFCKEVGAPKAFIVDSARTDKSNKVWPFLNKVGTTIRVLEGQTRHAYRAELYIGLMKSGVGKYSQDFHIFLTSSRLVCPSLSPNIWKFSLYPAAALPLKTPFPTPSKFSSVPPSCVNLSISYRYISIHVCKGGLLAYHSTCTVDAVLIFTPGSS